MYPNSLPEDMSVVEKEVPQRDANEHINGEGTSPLKVAKAGTMSASPKVSRALSVREPRPMSAQGRGAAAPNSQEHAEIPAATGSVVRVFFTSAQGRRAAAPNSQEHVEIRAATGSVVRVFLKGWLLCLLAATAMRIGCQ